MTKAPTPTIEHFSLRNLIDPVSLLLLLGLYGFYQFYGKRFLIFVAAALTILGLWAVAKKRWDIAVPIQTLFLGTWAYNVFEGQAHPLLAIMITFALLLGYAFWKLFGQPTVRTLTLLHSLYLLIATLIVWELAIIIKLFWPVEPWSRTFLLVAAVVFLHLAIHYRLQGGQSYRILLMPLVIVLVLTAVVIASTPIPLA